MNTNISTTGDSAVIRLTGRFDFAKHREFRSAVDAALASGKALIQIDLGNVEYLDSSALGMLLMARDKAVAAGKTVSLANAKGAVKQVLNIANFGQLFAIS